MFALFSIQTSTVLIGRPPFCPFVQFAVLRSRLALRLYKGWHLLFLKAGLFLHGGSLLHVRTDVPGWQGRARGRNRSRRSRRAGVAERRHLAVSHARSWPAGAGCLPPPPDGTLTLSCWPPPGPPPPLCVRIQVFVFFIALKNRLNPKPATH